MIHGNLILLLSLAVFRYPVHLRRSFLDEADGKFQAMPAHLHVYVPDTDALCAQAVRAGAISVIPPRNAPYGDRAATVKDPCGNTRCQATYFGTGQP
jgi:uncharacterized glyoxalase superfamily protein PhnB